MTRVATILLLYILSIQHPQKYLPVSIFYILRVEDNFNLCFLALTGESFSSEAGLGTSCKNGATSELYGLHTSQRVNEGSRKIVLHTAA